MVVLKNKKGKLKFLEDDVGQEFLVNNHNWRQLE